METKSTSPTTEHQDSPSNHSVDLNDGPLIFFDGVCGLCNWSVDLVLKLDKNEAFRFAPLQGKTAEELLTESDRKELSSVVLLNSNGKYRRSAAVVRIFWELSGFWSLLGTLLWLIPRPLRDLGYKLVVWNRYRLFGKQETCRMPTVEERNRFLD